MRRRLAAFVAAALAATGIALLAPAAPASATGVCIVGSGSIHMSAGLRFTVTTPAYVSVATTASFTAGFSVGACINTTGTTTTVKTLSFTGTVNGWCDHLALTGTTNDGQRFAAIGVGTTIVFTGDLLGMATMTPNVGESCGSMAGAKAFLSSGVFLKYHCLAKSKGLTTVNLPSTLTTVGPVSVHTAPWHFWTKVCVPSALL